MRLGLSRSSTPRVATLRPLIAIKLCSTLEVVLKSKPEKSELAMMAVSPCSEYRPLYLIYWEIAHYRTLFRLSGARTHRVCGMSSLLHYWL